MKSKRVVKAQVQPGVMPSLSEADLYALGKMPEGWFRIDDVSYMVRCPAYRCERLEAKGKLESRVVGDAPIEWRRQYRKI